MAGSKYIGIHSKRVGKESGSFFMPNLPNKVYKKSKIVYNILHRHAFERNCCLQELSLPVHCGCFGGFYRYGKNRRLTKMVPKSSLFIRIVAGAYVIYLGGKLINSSLADRPENYIL